jgi:hypothetical protein
MCTVSFVPTRTGFLFAMNRDEKKSRVAAEAPRRRRTGHHTSLHPAEPGGGSWIGVNQKGVALALINWYAMPQKDGPLASRGIVVPQLLAEARLDRLGQRLAFLPLPRINPFRLIAVSLAERRVEEWGWNGDCLKVSRKDWRRRHWFSSGFEEMTAARTRAQVAAGAARANLAGTLPWLRRLHQSHRPACGAFSICMHRDDAQTVSYTEISVEPLRARMRYGAGPPCMEKPGAPLTLAFTKHFHSEAFA